MAARIGFVPLLIALLFAFVIAAFFVSRRAGVWMLGAVSAAVVLMLAWTWYKDTGPEMQRNAIPVEQVEILDTRTRGNTTDYLIRNHNERWTLIAIRSEKVARLEDGTVVDSKEFTHRLEIPPQQARWQTLRFFGLEIGVDYEWRIIGTEGSRNP
jgi:hypothetical protein